MIWEFVTALGLGEQLVGAVVLGMVAWYLLRGLSLAGTIGVAVSSGVMYLVVSAVVLALALALGWLDPEPGAVRGTISAVREFAGSVLVDAVRGLIGRVVSG